ncbi:AMPKBI-domain-containing protein [Aureobasidium pullulans]|uniref:AMPKBI-domain-containing protein n=1 Tax=Aureobasidium pullulans TaxID=5580 RepID=A0A4S9UXU3_AURPU|nr:AMPKBI-domain-containing protein [Aureobasidium pullulans]THZ43008.1 AMPKBI-domain-containing protein [Aureobasidium pullulans]THZ55882.1 AMPKBI-domain-containing protein [Aureobasidium pullulans]TIA00762.1 AMPKBI-domain-containing protein [Aureobasidium pullulans]
MGNTPSSAKSEKGSQPASPAHALHHHHHREQHQHEARREPRRRESIPALTSKTAAASPSLDTTSASGQAIFPSAYSPSQPRSTPSSGHQRNRSNTANTPKQESSPSVPRRYKSLKSPSPPPEPRLSPASQPVDVPQSQRPHRPASPATEAANYLPQPASFSRPPRLPLPIEQEDHTPGSPIISAVLPDDGPEQADLPRRSSVVSSTVDDDDEEPDGFEGYETDAGGPKVPTLIEWRNAKPGERVYVTGTFTNWERKFRLHKDGPSKHKNALSATLQLPPGTHHIKFIANGDMLTSNDLPTTVDYTNILVNYIEVSLDQLPLVQPGKPVPAGPPPVKPQEPSRPMDIRPKPTAQAEKEASAANQPQNTLPKSSHEPPAPRSTAGTPAQPPADAPKPRQQPPLVRQSSREWTQTIPAYLTDLDSWYPPPSAKEDAQSPSGSAARYRFERANAAAESQPAPPSLPMFLSKSILNGTTPTKDDSSVLIMPNHTVLNHLATTNIKQGVLATSATTRYKRKFLTTIMYKPRSDGEE